ncbi:redoxin domain-containing protein [bacterium]|nr:redoxin domain-containing protein [bacterium]
MSSTGTYEFGQRLSRLRLYTFGLSAVVALVVTGISGWGSTAAQAADDSATAAVKPAPAFELMDTQGQTHKLADYLADGKTVVLEWYNPGCPYVKKYHDGASANTSMRDAYQFAHQHGVVWLAVNSGAPGMQGHGLELNQQMRAEYGIEYPVLLDESGTVGQAYGATSTPHLFIINPAGEIVYQGGVDDTVLMADQPSGNYVIAALKQLMAGEAVNPAETAHPGCSVKYAK